MITEVTGKCNYEHCEQEATQIACGRKSYRDQKGHDTPSCYCDAHAEIVSEEGSPEYVVDCPNCSCGFGVN